MLLTMISQIHISQLKLVNKFGNLNNIKCVPAILPLDPFNFHGHLLDIIFDQQNPLDLAAVWS